VEDVRKNQIGNHREFASVKSLMNIEASNKCKLWPLMQRIDWHTPGTEFTRSNLSFVFASDEVT
jgi:hypothetical protein